MPCWNPVGEVVTVNIILAALDLEAGSDAVLARAIQLATAQGARLLVLHVIEADPLSQVAAAIDRRPGDLQDELERQALARIESLLIAGDRDRRTDVQTGFGVPHEVTTRVAGERGADVIVIGPGKGRSLREKVLGSTADRVIRTAAVPVLVVRKAAAEPYRRVAVAVDFSPQSAAAVKEARRLAPQAAVQLVHAIDIPLHFEQALLRAGTPQTGIEKYRSVQTGKAQRDLTEFAAEFAGTGEVDIRVVRGEPGRALVRLSRGRSVDLVAVGTHGRGVALRALLGSVAQRVLKDAGCDVLVAS